MITLKNVLGLEQHKYAPELNKLHLKSGKIYRVPQKTTIKEAINFINLKK